MKPRSKFYSTKTISNLLFICFIHLFISLTSVFSQNPRTISISGSFWDDNNGVDLNSTVYGFVAGEKVKLGETDRKQRFNFELPTSVDSLVFESIGYNSVSIPVNFVGSFKNQSSANLSINSKGGLSQYQSRDLFAFCLPSTHINGMTYELFLNRNDSLIYATDFSLLIERSQNGIYLIRPTHISRTFKLSIKSPENEVLFEQNLNASKGFTFIDVNIYPSEKRLKTASELVERSIETPKDNIESNFKSFPYPTFGSRNLYFDQSKFELKSENRLILDSLAIYLQQKMNARINVTGYTDNVGKETLNAILAKYRTQVVANYLKNKGVKSSQINLDWENNKTDLKSSTNELSKFRKVVIEEIN